MNTSPSFKELLALPNFRKLWTSQLLSQLTINLVNFSILIHIYAYTRSSIAVSLLWVAYSLPSLFLAPFSGVIVDRFSLKRMMLVTNILQGLTVLTFLAFTRHIFLLYSLVFIYSFLDQFYVPAQQSSVPWLVPPQLLTAANGIFFLTQQASFLLGFGLAGLLIQFIGQTPTIILAASFLFIAAAAVFLLPADTERIRVEKYALTRFLEDFKSGYEFVKNHHQIRFPVYLSVAAQIMLTVITITMPSYTREVLGVNLSRASLLLIIPAGLAAVIFTYLLPRLLKNRRKIHIVKFGTLSAAISLMLLAWLGFTGGYRFVLSILTAIGLGISFAAVITPAQTAIQEHTPPEYRGRIYSFLGLLMTIFTLIPLLAAATLADLIGIAPIMGAFSLLIFIGYLMIHYKGDYVLANGFGF